MKTRTTSLFTLATAFLATSLAAQVTPKKICDLPRITSASSDLFFEVSASCSGSKSIAWSDLVTGLNAATATALAADGSDCSSGQAARGVDASGNATGCTQLPNNTTSTASNFFTAYNSTSGIYTKAQPAFTDISGTASAAQLPTPTSSTLGGVKSLASVSSKWINQIATDGTPSATQPAFSDLTGSATSAQMPTNLFASGSDTIAASSSGPALVITRADADATAPGFTCIKNRSGGGVSASDQICALNAQASNSTPTNLNFGQLVWTAVVATAGSESAKMEVKQRTGTGSLGTTWTFNEAGNIVGSGGTVTDAGHVVSLANGQTWTSACTSELLTLSTSGTTTDTSANLLPANSIIRAVTARVTTTIATATSWAVGDPTTSARFSPANSTLTAGTTSVGLTHVDQTGAAGPKQTSAAKVRITTVGTPSAGVIRLTACYDTFAAPTS